MAERNENKKKRPARFTICLDHEVKEPVEALAEANYRTMSAEILIAIENHLRANGITPSWLARKGKGDFAGSLVPAGSPHAN